MNENPYSTDFPKGTGQPAIRALRTAGFCDLESLRGASEHDLLALHGMGAKAMLTLKTALQERDIQFKT